MFGNYKASMDRIRQRFADQFTEESGLLVYRKSLLGPPVEVTQAERDRLVAAFSRDLGRLQWAFAAAVGLLTVTVVAGTIILNIDMSMWMIFAPMALLLVAYLLVWRRVWNAPMSTVTGRPIIGQATPRDEVRRSLLRKMPWSQIGVTAAGSLIAFSKVRWNRELWRGDNAVWLLLAVLVLGVAVFASVRKIVAMAPDERPRLRL